MIIKALIPVSGGFRATVVVNGQAYYIFGETKTECIINVVEVYPEVVVPSHFYQ